MDNAKKEICAIIRKQGKPDINADENSPENTELRKRIDEYNVSILFAAYNRNRRQHSIFKPKQQRVKYRSEKLCKINIFSKVILLRP